MALNHKWLDMHECVRSTVAIDALVLKHQGNNIHSVEYMRIVLDQFQTTLLQL